MHVGIGFVLELAGEKPAVSLREFDRFGDHAKASTCGRREHNLRPQEAHQLTPLHAKRLRHREDQRIPFLGAHHGQADPCVSARSLDNRLARLEPPRFLRIFNHTQSQTVLNGTKRIECLVFDKKVDVGRGQFVDLDHRSVADCFQDVGVSFSH